VAGGVAAAHGLEWQSLFGRLFGQWCTVNSAASDPSKLADLLEHGANSSDGCPTVPIVGQHIGLSVVPYVVATHLSDRSPQKPLVISLVGPTGVGKTMLSQRLATVLHDTLLPASSASLVLSAVDFRDSNEPAATAGRLIKKIARQIDSCSTSIIILDEVQFFPPGTLDYLIDLFGFQQPVEVPGYYRRVDFRRAIIVMTSNVGKKHVIEAFNKARTKDGRERNDLEYEEFRDNLTKAMKKVEYWTAYKNRIDYYVPFLPAERPQVLTVIRKTLEAWRCRQTKSNSRLRSLRWDDDVIQRLADRSSAANPIKGLSGIQNDLAVAVFAKITRAIGTSHVTTATTFDVVLSAPGQSGPIKVEATTSSSARERQTRSPTDLRSSTRPKGSDL